MRLKWEDQSLAKNINLFPDACTVTMNNQIIKEFLPLHKQSSLKFRRDDPINITTFIRPGPNKIVIYERTERS